jgi:hypothetical protein
MANRILPATTVDASWSRAASHTAARRKSGAAAHACWESGFPGGAICRAVGVTLTWLVGFLVPCVEALPDQLPVQPVTGDGNVMIQAPVGKDSGSRPSTREVLHRSIGRVRRGHACDAAPGDQQVARKTHHIERCNNTLRQRVSRLVRAALSFAKKLANYSGAIKLFICHYNLTRAAA